MNTQSREPQEWANCPPGTLAAFSQRAKSAARRRVAMKVGAGALAVIAIGLVVSNVGPWSAPREHFYAGISCEEVQENLPAVFDGKASDELHARIDAHLLECAACRKVVERMRADRAGADFRSPRWAHDCPTCHPALVDGGLAASGPVL